MQGQPRFTTIEELVDRIAHHFVTWQTSTDINERRYSYEWFHRLWVLYDIRKAYEDAQ